MILLSFIAAEAAHWFSFSRWDINHTVAPKHAAILLLYAGPRTDPEVTI
jgi:hypothetical protein